ncbi:hypothetical protein V2J09_015712 [Rumex salicifolius]
MDFGSDPGFRSGSMDSLSPGASGGNFDNWMPNVNDQAIWATEDEYRNWNSGTLGENQSNSNYVLGTPSRPGTEPPSKKSRNSQGVDLSSNRAKAIGRMFFKTKLCSKFRAGVCPYITNCNFAHGMEELRRPPPNWQDIVAAHDEERGVPVEQREEHQIPTVTSTEPRGETQRSYKGRHCKKFYTEEGCPYGYNCTFLHDEQSRSRESVAISVSPSVGGGGGGYAGAGVVLGGGGGGGGDGGGSSSGVVVVGGGGGGANEKPSNWKTRICNKWETTGNCPFGSKCHFAHGLAELHKYGGGLMETESRDSSAPMESKQGIIVAAKNDTVAASNLSTPRMDFHHAGPAGFPSQRPYNVMQQVGGQRSSQRWKGPDRISKIYGDWIDDIE